MSERRYKRQFKVDSQSVQGEGSWVLFKHLSYAEYKALTSDGSATGHTILAAMIEDWNWVDDGGEPLPKPDAQTIRDMPFQELTFLSEAVALPDMFNPKN